MIKRLVVVTGASRGLGKEIAVAYSNASTRVVLQGRNEGDLAEVGRICELKGAEVERVVMDFGSDDYGSIFNKVLAQETGRSFEETMLFNNASCIKPIGDFIKLSFEDYKRVVEVNLLATMCLSAEFLRFNQLINPKKSYIVNISSGVSKRAIAGWSLYCISKSAVNMLTQCLAEEAERLPFSFRTCAVNPGAMNTSMQADIRESSDGNEQVTEKFINMFEAGQLSNPKVCALKLQEILSERGWANGAFIDFNTF